MHRWRVGVNYGGFSSTLIFGNEHLDIGERAVLATLQFRASERWTLQASAGLLVDGALVSGNVQHLMRPGWLYGVAASYRVLDGARWMPFILVAGSFSASSTATQPSDAAGTGFHAQLMSFDVSAVVTVGKTFFRVLSPYLVGRVFGGPVFWQQAADLRTGTDAYHYQLGAGLAVALFQRFDAFAEYAPLGERRLSFGAGISF
jgi:hypothetical protein